MKRLISIIWASAAVFLMLAGCSKDSVTYSGHEAGNILSGVFTTDNGVEMNIVGNDGKYDITTERRVYVDYTTRPGMDAKHIDIDVNRVRDALMASLIPSGLLPEETDDAPIQISKAWFDAGYLNLLTSFVGKDLSKHMFSAAYSVTAEGITFRLYHDARNEPSASGTAWDVFVCVPMDDIAVTYKHCCEAVGKKPLSQIPFILQWTGNLTGKKALYDIEVTYKPSASN